MIHTRENNITLGKMYQTVISKERAGDFLGVCVQMVPHLTDAIIACIERVSCVPIDNSNEKPDICMYVFSEILPALGCLIANQET